VNKLITIRPWMSSRAFEIQFITGCTSHDVIIRVLIRLITDGKSFDIVQLYYWFHIDLTSDRLLGSSAGRRQVGRSLLPLGSVACPVTDIEIDEI
jgi:hypothetical protein